VHAAALAYVSDLFVSWPSWQPHLRTANTWPLLASLDHSIWLHRPCRADEWLLFRADSPVLAGSRGLVRGQVFQGERLVMSCAQELLVRLPRNIA
jgi:acyl-CoA thioesterase-2